MSMSPVRLLRIEVRRNLGLWLFVPLTILTLWVASGFLTTRIWLWNESSLALRNSIILLGPISGALACWMAGRDRRRGVTELLMSTPRLVESRFFANWAGTAAWALLVYGITCFAVGGLTGWNASWGRPDVTMIAVGVATLLAYTAIGFAVGIWISFRIIAPLTGVVLFVGQAIVTYSNSTLEHLSPIAYESTATSVFHQSRVDFHLTQVVWLLGAGLLALSLAMIRGRAGLRSIGALVPGLILATTGVILLLQSDGLDTRGAPVPYDPTCVEATIPICLHPAYETIHDETIDVIDRLVTPLVGVPGAPERAEQRSSWATMNDPEPVVLKLQLRNVARHGSQYADGGIHYFASVLVRQIVNYEQWYFPEETGVRGDPQPVIANWLLIQAGVPLREELSEFSSAIYGFLLDEEQQAALERFVDLDDDHQRAWLEAHFDSLRNGNLTLDDLP